MYLKRLELHGFKSFAGRTQFDFGQGITAIVGPNGSGKSNIADALRWVLGEQSTKLLRSKKLDDIIYTGSAKRARSDKVEVTLTLDNSDRWLPLDATEVAISRRGTRNGDSEYYINGKRAKLRDVQTLLATASVSQNSYAIIGQGLVESVLNLRAEDRRQLIEEAADIQRYRLKIEEAETRLIQTRENVERVKLLIKEIAPRMSQLERQARRAGEHSRLSFQLMQALRTYYDHRWHHAEEALTVARAAHDQAQAEFLQARVALETCQREVGEIAAQLEEQRKATAASQADRERLERKLRDAQQRLAVARERRGILDARQEELREEVVALEAERDRAKLLVSTGDDQRLALEEAVAAARKVLETRQTELSELEQEFRETHLHAADADAKSKRLQSVAGEMKSRIKRLTDAQEDLAKQASRLDGRRRSLVTHMAEQLRVIRGVRVQDVQVVAQVTETSVRRQNLESQVTELRETLAEVEAVQNGRRGKLEGLEARLKAITEAQEQAGGAEGTQAIEIQGALGTVYEAIRVPRGMEDAIASALAEHIEAFIFDHQVDALAAIQSVVGQKGPRATVLPLDSIKHVYPLNLMKEKGVLGVAAQLVKYPPRYEQLVNTLLGRTIVVQDVPTAVRLLKRRLGTVVTLEGIVFDQSGYISGGRPGASKPFVLSYERDIEAIPKEIEKIRRSLEITEREADAVRERLREATAALATLSREAEAGLDKRMNLQDSMAQRQQKLAQLRGEMRGLMGSLINLREQGRSYAEQAATLTQERESLLEESKEAGDTARQLGRADGIFGDRRRVVQRIVNEAADALAKVDSELRSLVLQRENAEAGLARIEAQASAKAVQLRGLEMELMTLDTTIASDDREATQTGEQLAALVQRLQPAEGTHHLEARQKDLNSQVVRAQNEMFEAERHTLETEAEVRRWETEIETLRQRIAEDGLRLGADGNIVPLQEPAEVPVWLLAEEEGGDGGLRPMQGGANVDPKLLAREIEGLRADIRALGPVNVEAQVDYESLRERHDFLAGHVQDLASAEESLRRAIHELTGLMRKRFETTFEQVARAFETNFNTFFGGGHAKLILTDPKNPGTSGVEIEARPPGKRTQSLNQLSGGEKALTSVSLLFALLQVNPSPFCVLDEVDAMLDEANVSRFARALGHLATRTQFVVITHNRRTIEVADSIYGISMAPDAASRVLSMRLGDVPASIVEN